MKDFLTNAAKKIEAIKNIANSHKVDTIDKLEDLKENVSKEFEKHIAKVYKKRDLVKEAVSKKVQLKKFKIGFFRQIFVPPSFKSLLSAPFIYAMIIPGVFLHIILEIYHQICFRLYGIPRVNLYDYMIIDRHHLAYLNWFEKFNCLYCSYFNGLMGYAREIAACTERYWCPIKHARRMQEPHSQYHLFVNYPEGEEFRKKKSNLRCFNGKNKK